MTTPSPSPASDDRDAPDDPPASADPEGRGDGAAPTGDDATRSGAAFNSYRLLAENLHDLVCLHRPDRAFVWLSPSCRRILGTAPSALTGVDPLDRVHPGDADRVRDRLFDAALEDVVDAGVTYRMRHADGHYVWIETVAGPLRNDAGTVVGVQSSSRDVTRRHATDPHDARSHEGRSHEGRSDEARSDEARSPGSGPQHSDRGANADATLRQQARRAVEMLGSITDGLLALDDAWRFVFVNPAAARLLDTDRETLLDACIWDLFPHLTGTRFDELFHRAVEHEVPIQLTEYDASLDVWLQAKAFPSENGLTVHLTDVSAERVAQQALFDGQHNATQLLESIRDAFFALDTEWRFTYVNERAETLLQQSAEALVGKNVWEMFPDAEGSRFEYEYRRAVEQNTPVEFTEYYPPLDFWVAVKAFPYDDGLSVYFSDVTRHKETEAALREKTRRHRLALQAAGMGEFDVDLRTGTLERSGLIDRFFGFDRAAPGPAVLSFAKRIHPDDFAGLRRSIEKAFDEPGPWRYEFRTRHPDGHLAWLAGRGETVQGPDGDPHLIGVLRDVTSQKQAALQREDLIQALWHSRE